MDRRTSIKWVIAASAMWPHLRPGAAAASRAPAHGYGTDPNLTKEYHAGELWPLTLTDPHRRLARALCDLIIPADDHSPAASEVGVVDFIDEWVSAPYPVCRRDRPVVLAGFAWLDAEAGRRFAKGFADLATGDQRAICDDICEVTRAAPAPRAAAQFFARYRDLTAGGFYSTPAGRKDLGYLGNVPLTSFEGPPAALLEKLGLS
jgi:Gluconate 2-dehydrogenase subunit 3